MVGNMNMKILENYVILRRRDFEFPTRIGGQELAELSAPVGADNFWARRSVTPRSV